MGEVVTTIFTIGFNVETIDFDSGTKLEIWDIGGLPKIRPLWKHYFMNSKAIVFFIAINEPERFPEAKEELANLLAAPELLGIPLLILLNKVDLISEG